MAIIIIMKVHSGGNLLIIINRLMWTCLTDCLKTGFEISEKARFDISVRYRDSIL